LVERDITDGQRNAKKSIERRESCIDGIIYCSPKIGANRFNSQFFSLVG